MKSSNDWKRGGRFLPTIGSSLLIGLMLFGAWGSALADVKLPAVISSHMVLQRDVAVPIWGTAAPGEEVVVEFAGQKKTVKAGDDGAWIVRLDPMPASAEPRTMTVAASNTVTLDDVLVGEVWLGSGQSNMAGGVGSYEKNDPGLRAWLDAAPYPHIRLKAAGAAGWHEATAANIRRFSALMFSFGAGLGKELDVPVGLMVGAVGGTPSGYWLTEPMFADDDACGAAVERAKKTYSDEKAAADHRRQLANWSNEVVKARAKNGEEPKRPDPPLKPGECRPKMGHLFEKLIHPFVPYGIRGVLWDQGEAGTQIGSVDQYAVMGALIRGWRKTWAQGEFPFIYVQKPSGGGCAFDPADPVTAQADKFAALPQTVPADGASRALHLRIREHPNTAMVSCSDLGSGVHPINKSGYAARGVRVALGFVYGRDVEIYGPVYASHKVEGSKVRIAFTHIGKGLAFRGGDKLQGFALAGADGKFVWADAIIDGDSVVVSSAKVVAAPSAVSYAWAGRHPWANLFNKDGLPALPFNTREMVGR
jgi:sialate O-acetylesterase